jgi:hypothetical protein
MVEKHLGKGAEEVVDQEGSSGGREFAHAKCAPWHANPQRSSRWPIASS